MKDNAVCFSESELQSYLRGELNAAQATRLEEHLGSCTDCHLALQNSAGDFAWWEDVEVAMRESVEGDIGEDSDLRHHHSLLRLLGPTDDPDRMGRIGPYEVVGILGQGGMGAVFKAFDSGLNRFVAIKILLPHLAAAGAARARFRREGQAAAAVVNDHVLPIYAVDEWQGTPYLVMQYVRGATLQKRLTEQGPLRLSELLRIGLHAAKGLAAAHAQGLVHRDVKPSNILLDGSVERAILSDFGLARAVDDASLTRSGMLAGTPQYMSPEQVLGDQLDQRSDLFSLGSVLYAMSTGRPPFQAESSYVVLRQITDQKPRPIRELRPDLPEWLESLIEWLMDKDPAKRPESARAVEQMLQQCLAHREQPQASPLPNDLLKRQSAGASPYFRRVAMLSLGGITAGLLVYLGMNALLTGPPTPRPAEPSPTQTSAEDGTESTSKGETTAGGYRIRVTGVGSVAGWSPSMDFRPNLNSGSTFESQFGEVTSNEFGDVQRFENRNGASGVAGGFGRATAGGGGFGRAGGGGATFGGSGVQSNVGIAFEIEPESREARRKSGLVELSQKIKVTDRDGQVSESQDMGPLRITYPDFEREYKTPYAAYLYRESGAEGGIKQIEGELFVTPGRRVEVVFNGVRPQKKQSERETFQLRRVESDGDGIEVEVTFPETAEMKKAGNILAKVEAFTRTMNDYELKLEDSQGNVYLPSGKSSSGGGGGSSGSFSINGRVQTRSSGTPEISMSTIRFRFSALPEGAEIKSIKASMVEREGEPEAVPFKIELESE